MIKILLFLFAAVASADVTCPDDGPGVTSTAALCANDWRTVPLGRWVVGRDLSIPDLDPGGAGMHGILVAHGNDCALPHIIYRWPLDSDSLVPVVTPVDCIYPVHLVDDFELPSGTPVAVTGSKGQEIHGTLFGQILRDNIGHIHLVEHALSSGLDLTTRRAYLNVTPLDGTEPGPEPVDSFTWLPMDDPRWMKTRTATLIVDLLDGTSEPVEAGNSYFFAEKSGPGRENVYLRIADTDTGILLTDLSNTSAPILPEPEPDSEPDLVVTKQQMYGVLTRIENLITTDSPQAAFSTAGALIRDRELLQQRITAIRELIREAD